MPENSPLKPAAFVQALVKDLTCPPQTKTFLGFPGEAAEPGHTRIYLDSKLSSHVEVPNDSILHHQRIPPERSILEAYAVWVDAEAEVIETHGVRRRKAKFLKGGIQDRNADYPYGSTEGCDFPCPSIQTPKLEIS